MKKIFFSAMLLVAGSVSAQDVFVETFDANSFEWTECAYKSRNGTAVIDKGVMTVTSKGVDKVMEGFFGAGTGGENTFFETHCYMPIDVMKPFKINTNVTIDKLSNDKRVGLVFNYRDAGNFYTMMFDDESVSFVRYVNNNIVGAITQEVKWGKKNKLDQQWSLISDGNTITFMVDGVPLLSVKHMPLEYDGFGYYTFGKQKLVVYDVEFIQE